MKKMNPIKIFYAVVMLGLCMASCMKFEPAEVKLTTAHHLATNVVECKATITDNGGCPNFTEQGAMYSFYQEPTLLDNYAMIECFNKNKKETDFTFNFVLPLYDTIYYVRAYVKTNAGIGYSNIVKINTYLPIDTTEVK